MAGWDNLFTRLGSRLAKAFSRVRRDRGETNAGNAIMRLLGSGATGGSDSWSQDRDEQVRHYRTWVYIAIRAIARQMAMDAPEFAYRLKPSQTVGRKSFADLRVPHHVRQKSFNSARENEELEYVDADHPLKRLFANPNGPDTAFDFIFEHILFKSLTGSAYWWLPPATELQRRMGLPGEMWVLPSNWVRPRWSGGAWVDYYEVRPYSVGGGSKTIEIPDDQIVPFVDKHPYHKRDGWAALTAGANWVDTSDTVDRLSLKSLQRAAFPSLSIDVDEKTSIDPDDEELVRIMAKVRARLQGEENVGEIVFNRQGAKTNILNGVSGFDIGFLTGRTQIRDAVLSLFGTPYTAAMIVGGATHENFYESMQAWHHCTINPEKRMTSQVITEKICSRFDPSITCVMKDTTPIDPAVRDAETRTLSDCGIASVNELRKRYGWEPYPEPEYDRPAVKPQPSAEDQAKLDAKTAAAAKPAAGPAFSRNGTAGRQPAKN